MKFRSLMSVASVVSFLFGAYLLWYGTVALSGYMAVPIKEAAAQDSHGMSLLASYTLVRMVGTLVVGLGFLTWLMRNVRDRRARRAITLGLSLTSLFAFVVACFQQNVFWQTGWGKLYVAVFLFLTICFTTGLLITRRGTEY